MLPAQVRKVDPKKTITFEVPGATAAYGLDEFIAEATADNGQVAVTGNQPGMTQVIVVTPAGTQTFDIRVTQPPPNYPAGFEMPVSASELAQNGYYEGRYYSSPAQLQNTFDFMKISESGRTHMHLVESSFLGSLDLGPGQSRTELSSATYQVATDRRDITLFDQYIDESQLTINGSIVRGFHMRQDNWFVHAGYASVAVFEGLFLPTQPELITGGGYIYHLGQNSSLTGSFYRVQVPASDRIGRSGNIGDLRYRYSPWDDFWFTADLGISHGIGGAGRLHYITRRDSLLGMVRYMPLQFAALGANNMRGLHADIAWTRHVTTKFQTSLSIYNNNLVLPGFKEKTASATANLRYQLTRHWAVNGGALASSFQTLEPLTQAVRTLTMPVGLDFQSRYFGASGQYQFALTPGRDNGGKQFRASVRTGRGAFSFSAYILRDTNAPTLSFIFGQVSGLQQLLEQQGIRATTVQQVEELLSNDAFLIAAGYIKGATINLVPVRTQMGGTAAWTNRGLHRKELSYNFLYNNNQMIQGSTESVSHTLTYSQRFSRADSLSLSCSIFGEKSPGGPSEYSPICFVAWRHQFQHVPYFIIPERRGAITGKAFRDDQSKGALEPEMRPMADVEITLDDRRRTLTRADGSYRFHGVPRGKHRIVAIYKSQEPFFFTTPAYLEVDEDATVDFGIGHSLSGLMGQVMNDAGTGVAGVTIVIRGKEKKWTAQTEADGSFFVSSLLAGDYDVQADEDSLPAGYSAETLAEPQRVTVGTSSPGKAAFTARAHRSISGRVLRYDSQAGRNVPVAGALVTLRERSLNTATDSAGGYLFRDLPAGSYTISAPNEAQTSTRTVQLGAQPVDIVNVDFRTSQPGLPDESRVAIPAPPAGKLPGQPRVQPQPIAAAAVEPLAVTAQQHHLLGRQLNQAGRYREAIVELTLALRLAPDFALALNARGYALFMLHDCAVAIADLDKAILLNPGYANAYHIRGIARKAIGDAPGAAADLARSAQLAH